MPEEDNIDNILDEMNTLAAGAEETEEAKETEDGKAKVTEENIEEKKESTENEESQPVKVEKKQLTDVEKKALSMGWTPQEYYYGDDDKYWPAEIYVARHERSEEIKRLRLENNELQEKLKNTNKATEENNISRLLAERKEAIMEADIEKVEEYDKQIESLKKTTSDTATDSAYSKKQLVQEEVNKFTDRNSSWFNDDNIKNIEMKRYAVDIETAMAKSPRYQNVSLADRFAQVEEAVKNKFSDNFVNPNKKRATSVEAGGKTASSRHNFNSLSSEVQSVINQFDEMADGKLDKDAYMQELEKQGVI